MRRGRRAGTCRGKHTSRQTHHSVEERAVKTEGPGSECITVGLVQPSPIMLVIDEGQDSEKALSPVDGLAAGIVSLGITLPSRATRPARQPASRR